MPTARDWEIIGYLLWAVLIFGGLAISAVLWIALVVFQRRRDGDEVNSATGHPPVPREKENHG